jgi:hypothetical protein
MELTIGWTFYRVFNLVVFLCDLKIIFWDWFERRPLLGQAPVPAPTRATTGGLPLQKMADNRIKPHFLKEYPN